MAKENIVIEKSYAFALRIIKLYKYLADTHKEYVISKQVLRSGTAIDALLSELVYAQSKADFINKAHVALKEANETAYWLSLLKDSEYISIDSYNSIYTDCNELIKLLVSIVKTSKNNQ